MHVRLASVVATTALLIGAAFLSAPAATAGRPPLGVHHGFVIAARVPSAGVLYDQNDRDAGTSVSSQYFGAEFDSYDDQAADDFRVPAGITWRIRNVTVTGVYFNGKGPADSENVFFYRDSGGLPGRLKAEVDSVVGVDRRGSFAIPIPGARLRGGANGTVFWVSVQINMDFVAGGQWGWETRKLRNGYLAAWQNPHAGWGFCTSWQPMRDCWDAGPDLMFALSGKQR